MVLFGCYTDIYFIFTKINEMKKLLCAFFVFSSFLSLAGVHDFYIANSFSPAKKKESKIDKTRILLGPGLGFGAASRAFSINLAPSVAYAFTDNFNVGATLGFNYYQQAFDYQNLLTLEKETYKYKLPAYSFSVFARYLIGDMFIIGFEPELNNTKLIADPEYNLNTGRLQDVSRRIFVPSVLVSGGLIQKMSDLSYYYVMIGYDLVQNPNARYYQTLDYRVGIMVQLWQ